MKSRNTATRAATAFVAGGALIALAGCSGASDGADGAEGDGGTITLRYQSWLPTVDQWTPIIEAFEAAHPDIEIDFQGADDATNYFTELDNLILAGETPDMFGIQVGSAFDDYAEFAMPTEDYAADWIDGIKPELLEETSTSDGEVKAVPILTAGSEFYLYNKTAFDELGLSLPESYEDMVAIADAANAAGMTPFAMGAADAWHDVDFFVWLSNQYGEGGDIYRAAAGEIPWESDALVAAAERWAQLFSDGIFQEAATSTTTYPSARDDYFLAGNSLAMPTGSWHVSATLAGNAETPGSAVEGDEIGMAPLPTLGDNEALATSGVDYSIALSSELEGDKLEAATAFAEFLSVGEGQQIWVNMMQGFPAATDISPELGDDESQIALDSVQAVTDSLQAAAYPRKVTSATNGGLENDLGVVLQNIANGAGAATELATLND
ncbi:ABC transporter substrate-binding protein [Demequina sp. NBRC 110055]|uniref:ABC transporter substrate-binding protein n=1 Tax=Demequina sp. NBRC 110055 TaxID=1570344 RepID=UPI0013564B85|nr:extracellular solute-binding protein [Demequina sp. NBRC 110055]